MRHLVAISVGPVQDFIAQARRSRDLWSGSFILSELSRAAARALASQPGVTLVFPSHEAESAELQPRDAPFRPDGEQVKAVANKILAHLAVEADVSQALEATREAIRRRWRGISQSVLTGPQGALVDADIRALASQLEPDPNVWTEQIEGVLEVYGAALPLADDSPTTFDTTRRVLDEALAARKSVRDFAQQRQQRHGAPKSSLDGGRVSVLVRDRTEPQARNQAARFRIPASEELDAVGLVKRAWGNPDQFTAVANVALAQWFDVARREPGVSERLDDLEGSAKQFGTVDGRLLHGKLFGADAQCLFDDRLPALFEESGLSKTDARNRAREFVQTHLLPLRSELAVPPPAYVAVLVADGDRMGELIDQASRLGGVGALHPLSKQLDDFAVDARRIVEEHLGSLVYAGGDDVLAFLPVGTAVACATKLRDRFVNLMGRVAKDARVERPPTLSVGIGIGHFITGMGELLDLGRSAEKAAKGNDLPEKEQRDALAVLLDKRSGAPALWRAQWEQARKALPKAIERLRSKQVPATKLYQVRDVLSRMPGRQDVKVGDPEGRDWVRTLAGDVLRTLNRADGGQARRTLNDYGFSDLGEASYPDALAHAERWVRLHVIARDIMRLTYEPEPGPATEEGADA